MLNILTVPSVLAYKRVKIVTIWEKVIIPRGPISHSVSSCQCVLSSDALLDPVKWFYRLSNNMRSGHSCNRKLLLKVSAV